MLYSSAVSGNRHSIYNLQHKKESRQDLRNHSTSAEATLWKQLKGRQLNGKKFRRQHGIGPYIVDFFCPECRLVVELDGKPHLNEYGAEYDERRTGYLKECGVTVIRFENKMVFKELEFVLSTIVEKLKTTR